MSEQETSVRDLVEIFTAAPVPDFRSTVDLDAAIALCLWLNHPHVCSGGDLSDKYVRPYLASLINEVTHLRKVEAAASRLIRNDNERRWDASEAVPARDELHRLLQIPPR